VKPSALLASNSIAVTAAERIIGILKNEIQLSVDVV
jgi:hypothetical protein